MQMLVLGPDPFFGVYAVVPNYDVYSVAVVACYVGTLITLVRHTKKYFHIMQCYFECLNLL